MTPSSVCPDTRVISANPDESNPVLFIFGAEAVLLRVGCVKLPGEGSSNNHKVHTFGLDPVSLEE
jgi:hypothetical protein